MWTQTESLEEELHLLSFIVLKHAHIHTQQNVLDLAGFVPSCSNMKKKTKLIKLKLIKIPQLFPSISLTWVLLFIFLFYNEIK